MAPANSRWQPQTSPNGFETSPDSPQSVPDSTRCLQTAPDSPDRPDSPRWGVYIWWNGMVEWNGGMEWWNGMVEWNGGMDYWNGGMLHRTYLIIQHVLYSEQ